MDLSHASGLTKIMNSALPNATNRQSSCSESTTGFDAIAVKNPAMSPRLPNHPKPRLEMLRFNQKFPLASPRFFGP